MASFALEMAFDGGFENYGKALESEADLLKNAKDLFSDIIDYFEGKADGLKSPIEQIFESDGQLIGGKWESISPKYKKQKEKVWQSVREFSVPFGLHNQIYTGNQYDSLVNSKNRDAVRAANNTAMVYGTAADYAEDNQSRFHILDFFPNMEKGIDRVLVRYMQKIKTLEITE